MSYPAERRHNFNVRTLFVCEHALMPLERMMGIEPTISAWEANVLPLHYIRIFPFQNWSAWDGRESVPSLTSLPLSPIPVCTVERTTALPFDNITVTDAVHLTQDSYGYEYIARMKRINALSLLTML